ncbi:hypothetical protein IPJ72_06250 [Candidatus Peregrinibacteria bacterium]|nr:MAG: hypothetical protein IPJ72_06250 [Candidatus Peregrinibacteria bacterium]
MIVVIGVVYGRNVHAVFHSGGLSVRLQLEINDGSSGNDRDFNDQNKTVEKGRLLQYRIQVENKTAHHLKNVIVHMDVPAYLDYRPHSAIQLNTLAPLVGGETQSPFVNGYKIPSLPSGEQWAAEWQAQVKLDLPDDVLHNLAWALVYDDQTAIPRASNVIPLTIEGSPQPRLVVSLDSFPKANQAVRSGEIIQYRYRIENVGGLPASQVRLLWAAPPYTQCQQNCQSVLMPTLATAGIEEAVLQVQVGDVPMTDAVIRHQPVQVRVDNQWETTVDFAWEHPVINAWIDNPTSPFRVMIRQSPNTVLNSPNQAARKDGADRTESKYQIHFSGTGAGPLLAQISPQFGPNPVNPTREPSCLEYYAYPPGTTFTTYNSSDPPALDCQGPRPTDATRAGCQLQLAPSPLAVTIQTELPQSAPALEWVAPYEPNYLHAMPLVALNQFMASGGIFEVIPPNRDFHKSRATQNGALGTVKTSIRLDAVEKKWRFEPDGTTARVCQIPGGKGASSPYSIPRYRWQLVGSPQTITLQDEAQTHITVYTSTAWLKTERGHVATNDAWTNRQNQANQVSLGLEQYSYYTDSATYSPPGEYNGDYMIFGKNGTDAMTSRAGEKWQQTGTAFPFASRGEAYERTDNARNFKTDLIEKQRYGPVKVDQLPAKLTGTIQLENQTVWYQTGDLVLGNEGIDDTITWAGGQSRIYVEGTVFINANLKYATSSASHHPSITAVRIDARDIVISGEVETIESFLLARSQFFSGESDRQLRILGDVIADQANWQRRPLAQVNPATFNAPSEHIIEDPRKYVLPPPGDAGLSDTNHWWRQD